MTGEEAGFPEITAGSGGSAATADAGIKLGGNSGGGAWRRGFLNGLFPRLLLSLGSSRVRNQIGWKNSLLLRMAPKSISAESAGEAEDVVAAEDVLGAEAAVITGVA